MALERALIDQMVSDVGPEAFQRLAALFKDETREGVLEIARLIAADPVDWRELGRQAHSMKHATSSFGLSGLAARALQIESAADAADGRAATQGFAALRKIAEPALEELSVFIQGADVKDAE